MYIQWVSITFWARTLEQMFPLVAQILKHKGSLVEIRGC